jgi:hypothetical protein
MWSTNPRNLGWVVLTILPVIVLLLPSLAAAQTVEYFVQGDFRTAVGPRNVIGFDVPAQADNALVGGEYLGCGLSFEQTDGASINVVGNTAPGGFGGNYVTEANIDTVSNAVSTSAGASGSANLSDNFDFVLSVPTSAAGVVVGNLGNCGQTNTTTVQFLDEFETVIAEELLAQDHFDMIWGTADDGGLCGGLDPVPFDNRLFYGITTNEVIERIRVFNGGGDGDGIVIDSVQYTSHTICNCDFETGGVCLSLRTVQ